MAEHDVHSIGTAKFEEVSMLPRNILLRNQSVAKGDVRVTSKLKSNMFLECVQAGTTAATMPSMSTSTAEGTVITDGTAKFIVRSVGPAVYHFRQPLTAYAVGDVVYSTKLPSYLRLECVAAGTTTTTEPSYSGKTAGTYVTDGTAVFLVCDIRDGLQVGDIKLSPILRPGYVKANGALLSNARTNYPRLVAFLTANTSLNAGNDTAWNSNKALYVYNSSANTLRVPDATGRVLQGGASAGMLAAGVPNITGSQGYIDTTGGYTVSSTSALYLDGRGSQVAQKTSGSPATGLNFNASRSNSLYGSSTTVQPPALTMIPQIKY